MIRECASMRKFKSRGLCCCVAAAIGYCKGTRGGEYITRLHDRVQVHIAQRHLLPKLLSEHGLSVGQLTFPREVLAAVASGWTREAGVRRLSQVRVSGDGCCICI